MIPPLVDPIELFLAKLAKDPIEPTNIAIEPGLRSILSSQADQTSQKSILLVKKIDTDLSALLFSHQSSVLKMSQEAGQVSTQLNASNQCSLKGREKRNQDLAIFDNRMGPPVEYGPFIPKTSRTLTLWEGEMMMNQIDRMNNTHTVANINGVLAYPVTKTIELLFQGTHNICQSHPEVQKTCKSLAASVSEAYKSVLNFTPLSWKKAASSFLEERAKALEQEAFFFKTHMGIPTPMTEQYQQDRLENLLSFVMMGTISGVKKLLLSKPIIPAPAPLSSATRFPKRGEIYWINLAPAIGSETNKIRPGLIVSNNIGNEKTGIVMIAPITSKVVRFYPYEVGTLLSNKPAKIMFNHMQAVDKSRLLGKKIGKVDDTTMKAAEKAMKIALGIQDTASLPIKPIDSAKDLLTPKKPIFAPHLLSDELHYKEAFNAFVNPKEFQGVFSKDLLVVQYHSLGLPGPDRTWKWWIPVTSANPLHTIEKVMDQFGLLSKWQPRTHVTVAKIPANHPLKFIYGKAKETIDLKEIRPGGGTQYCFYEFDSKWIIETRALPTQIPQNLKKSQGTKK